jgi:tRNA nucleotidyltransferase (CCA-adding enzyme)
MDKFPQAGTPSSPLSVNLDEAKKRLCALSESAAVSRLLTTLQPGEVFLVGGVVRDALVGNPITDLDVATNLPIETVLERCTTAQLKVVATGIQHGTLLVVSEGTHIEVTTYREPSDRATHIYGKTIETDLSGRDFTINAIAFNLITKTFTDPWHGVADLRENTVRAVGDPLNRFAEDPLRILRMVRFGPSQGRILDENTRSAATSLVSRLSSVSVERIKSELEKILLSSHPDNGVSCLKDIGALPFTIPELIPAIGFEQNEYHIHDVFEHTLWVLQRTPCDRMLRWAAIFHDIGKPHTLSVDDIGRRHFYLHEKVSAELALERMKALRFSHHEMDAIGAIVRHHMRPLECGPAGVRRVIRDLGTLLPQWRQFKEADMSPTMAVEDFQRTAHQFDEMVSVEHERSKIPTYGKLAVSGSDLVELGMKPGPALGKLLKQLEEIVVEDPSLNTTEYLLAQARKKISK